MKRLLCPKVFNSFINVAWQVLNHWFKSYHTNSPEGSSKGTLTLSWGEQFIYTTHQYTTTLLLHTLTGLIIVALRESSTLNSSIDIIWASVLLLGWQTDTSRDKRPPTNRFPSASLPFDFLQCTLLLRLLLLSLLHYGKIVKNSQKEDPVILCFHRCCSVVSSPVARCVVEVEDGTSSATFSSLWSDETNF